MINEVWSHSRTLHLVSFVPSQQTYEGSDSAPVSGPPEKLSMQQKRDEDPVRWFRVQEQGLLTGTTTGLQDQTPEERRTSRSLCSALMAVPRR